MREIKFTTQYENALSFDDKDFKEKYEKRVGDRSEYMQVIDGDKKHLAVCPRCNNPVVILGIYKKIEQKPHARHKKNINIPNVAEYNEYKYLNCPYHKKNAPYIKEYVPEAERPQRVELYQIAKAHFDKAIYLLEKEIGIYINLDMAEKL